MKCQAAYEAYVLEDDYRKYVGPRWAYDMEGAWQFMVMCLLGLREHHDFLEVAAGSLRGGRLFIPYLRPGKYCAVEPQRKMVELGIANEVGQSQLEIKRPQFAYNTQFDFTSFDRKFDYVLAHRLINHIARDQVAALVRNASAVLKDGGQLVGNFNIGERDTHHEPVPYGAVTHLTEATMKEQVEAAGLAYVALPFNDRRADERWFVAVKPELYKVTADSALGYMMSYWDGMNAAMGHTDA